MSWKRKILFVSIVVIGGLLLTTPWRIAAPGWRPWSRDHCPLDGAWVKKSETTDEVSIERVSRVVPDVSQWTSTVEVINPDPSFSDPSLNIPFPPFSDADSLSSFVGVMERTGLDTYDFRMQAYGTEQVEGKSRPQINYICVIEGAGRFIDRDTREEEFYVSLYRRNEDGDADGLPDEGESPFMSFGPVTTVVNRL